MSDYYIINKEEKSVYDDNKKKIINYCNENNIVYKLNKDEDTFEFSLEFPAKNPYYLDEKTRIFVEYYLGLGTFDISVDGCKIYRDYCSEEMKTCIKNTFQNLISL